MITDISVTGTGLVMVKSLAVNRNADVLYSTQFERLLDRGEAAFVWDLLEQVDARQR